jgi:cell wall-associated NlpC family hydrolase
MVIANSFSEIKLKLVDNPIYKEYLTFLSSQEIGEMQNFLSIFEALHPEFQTYTFNNLQVGDIDIGTVFTLKQSTLPNAAYGYDRIANAYQILFTYTKARPETSGFFGDHESANNPQNSTFTPRFVLSAEAAFLVVDKAPNGVSDFSNIKPESALSTQSYSAGDIANLNSDPCIDGAATGSGTNLPTSGDVASNAEAIMASGATYKWGCWGPGRKSRDDGHVCGNEYDCSGFVWQALTMAGYPKSIPVQSGKMMQWASKHGGLVESNGYDKMKRGDLVFVYRASGEIHHVAIATGPSEVIHALNHKLGVKKSPASRYLTRGKRYVIYRLDPKFKTGTKKTEGEK